MTDDGEQAILHLETGSEWRFELEADENIAVRVSRDERGGTTVRWQQHW